MQRRLELSTKQLKNTGKYRCFLRKSVVAGEGIRHVVPHLRKFAVGDRRPRPPIYLIEPPAPGVLRPWCHNYQKLNPDTNRG